MRGCIIQRKDKDGNPIGNYRVKVCLGKNSQGKYDSFYETMPDGASKADAQKRLRQLLTELDKGVFVKPSKLTVANYLESWLTDYCKPNLSPGSTETYRIMVNKYISPALGIIPLTDLKPAQIKHLIAELQNKGICRTAKYVHSTLSKALNTALKTGLISRNPVDAIDTPKVERYEFKPMSEADIKLFLDNARNTPYHALFYSSLFCGMRRSELLGLRWADVDLLLLQIYVNRTLHHVGKETIIRQPKTAKSRRSIALSPSTCIVLREHREAQDKLRQSLGQNPTSDSDLVFCHWDGKPLLPSTVTHAWIKLARRSGLKGVRLHDARHTHASLLLKQGIHPKVVQERLGHATISTTLDTYSHVSPGLQAAAANKFDDIVMGYKELVPAKIN